MNALNLNVGDVIHYGNFPLFGWQMTRQRWEFGSAFISNFQLMYSLEGSRWWFKYWSLCHLQVKPGLNSQVPASARLSPDSCMHLWNETSRWKVSLNLSLCLSVYINIKKKKMRKFFFLNMVRHIQCLRQGLILHSAMLADFPKNDRIFALE